ncbi:hypothetical protein DWZ56_01075 [Lachnotalea sp. AF33-28]|jgi:hypothetical protein|nr:hypothetical protein DWZ56_01075 [Lachnotalea sp. AF33-28]
MHITAEKVKIKPQTGYCRSYGAAEKLCEIGEHDMGDLSMMGTEKENSAGQRCFEGMGTMILWFTSYEKRVAKGILQNLYYEKTFPFESMDQLLMIMDDILELVHWPEAEFPRQSLDGCCGCTDFAELDPKLDRAAAGAGKWQRVRNGMECAAVRILCRQHASIQGELRMNGITANFRSGMELMRMLHQLLFNKYGQSELS